MLAIDPRQGLVKAKVRGKSVKLFLDMGFFFHFYSSMCACVCLAQGILICRSSLIWKSVKLECLDSSTKILDIFMSQPLEFVQTTKIWAAIKYSQALMQGSRWIKTSSLLYRKL